MRIIITLFARYFWQVSSCLFGPTVVVELYSDPVDPDLPVEEVGGVHKVAENRNRDVKLGKLLPGHRVETRVFHGTANEEMKRSNVTKFFKARRTSENVKRHLVKLRAIWVV